jgi:hypothetical protein
MSALGHKRTLKHFHAMSALAPKADIKESEDHVRFVPKSRHRRATDEGVCDSFLVVAYTANLVAYLRIEGSFLERLVRSRSRPPVGGFLYRSVTGIMHDRLTKRRTMLALKVLQMLTLILGMCCEDAVGNIRRSRSLKPPSPLLNISSAFVLFSFNAATALSSIALASSAVPN